MPSKPSEGVKVRGACRHGHITQTTSPPGRVTWRGECSDPKCKERVICRRAPAEKPADQPAGEPEQAAPNTARKVSWNAKVPKHQQPGDPGAGQPAGDGDEHDYRHDGEPATGQGQAVAQSTVPASSDAPRTDNGQPRRGRTGQLAEHIHSRRTARATRPRPEYRTRFPFEP